MAMPRFSSGIYEVVSCLLRTILVMTYKIMNIAKKINLKEDEKIVALVRPYGLTYGWKYFIGFALLAASSFFMFLLFFYGWWGQIIYGLGVAISLYYIFKALIIDRNNILVITSARVVDLHRVGWFDEIVSSINYLEVKDVAVRKKGIWQSMCNFGGLAVQTKSNDLSVEVFGIRNPVKLQGLISDLSQQYKQDIKIANTQVIYNNFIKIVPNLPDGDLRMAQKLIAEQLNPKVGGDERA